MPFGYAADSEAKIINISLGFRHDQPKKRTAIKYALSKGKMIFAGSGNEAEEGNPVAYPAAYPGVIGVSGRQERQSYG